MEQSIAVAPRSKLQSITNSTIFILNTGGFVAMKVGHHLALVDQTITWLGNTVMNKTKGKNIQLCSIENALFVAKSNLLMVFLPSPVQLPPDGQNLFG